MTQNTTPLSSRIIEQLGLDPKDYSQWKTKGENFLVHQLRRKIRYACFAKQRGDDENISKELIKHFEAQPDFSGWDLFADRWDVTKTDPTQTYPRLFSTLDEWEAKLSMCVPEVPNAIAYKQSR